MPRPRRATEFAGIGCVVQGVGVLVAVAGLMVGGGVFVVAEHVNTSEIMLAALIVGGVLFLLGSSQAVSWVCPNCRNRLTSRKVRMCPVCRTPFMPGVATRVRPRSEGDPNGHPHDRQHGD